jgi:5-methylcytosine-specific restriction endonuclease McrA
MRICKKCLHSLSIESFGKSTAFKDGVNSSCKSCHNLKAKAWADSNRDKTRGYTNQWKKSNPDKVKDYNIINSKSQSILKLKWLKNNPEKVSNSCRKWRKSNPGKVNHNHAKRRTAKLNCTPKWLTVDDLQKIQDFYIEAAKRTRDTGVSHQVDHIIPLQGKTVSGLHVPWNLQILTKVENSSKNNKLIQIGRTLP